MQKVIIKNLGPIKHCEIELKPFIVLVGDSGVGKSIVLRTISLLKWIYKKMQYKNLLKHSKTKSDALRFRLDGLLKNSMLDDFFTKNSYIEFIENDKPIITIENGKLKPQYKNIKKDKLIIGKILFLNDIRSSLAEILSSPSGKRAKYSYYTNDMIENFDESLRHFDTFELLSLNASITSKKKAVYKQIYLIKDNESIKFENSSSGEKNVSIIELICGYFANKYDFSEGFSNAIVDLISKRIEFTNLTNLQDYIKNKHFETFMDFFIEEPEINLYPQRQKLITNFLASLQNTTNKPEIMISTHSPYILTTLNNLLYAGKLSKNGISVDTVINLEHILDSDKFDALLIENGSAMSIIDHETGLINAEKLDKVSGDIMDEFYELCELDPQQDKYE